MLCFGCPEPLIPSWKPRSFSPVACWSYGIPCLAMRYDHTLPNAASSSWPPANAPDRQNVPRMGADPLRYPVGDQSVSRGHWVFITPYAITPAVFWCVHTRQSKNCRSHVSSDIAEQPQAQNYLTVILYYNMLREYSSKRYRYLSEWGARQWRRGSSRGNGHEKGDLNLPCPDNQSVNSNSPRQERVLYPDQSVLHGHGLRAELRSSVDNGQPYARPRYRSRASIQREQGSRSAAAYRLGAVLAQVAI